jgi:sodium transport system permease protein
MRWSIIRLIWARELRDQLRDRRTIFMIAILPILLYPVAGFGVVQLAVGFVKQENMVGIEGAERLLPWMPEQSLRTHLTWLTITPTPGVPLVGIERTCTASAQVHVQQRLNYPPLLEKDAEGRLHFPRRYFDSEKQAGTLRVQTIDPPARGAGGPPAPRLDGPGGEMLKSRTIDLLLVVQPGFQERLERGQRPALHVYTREKDDISRLVNMRVTALLNRWRKDLKEARLLREGLPPDFDEPFRIDDPERAKPPGRQE